MTKESLFHMCDTIRIIPANAQFSLYFPEYLFLQISICRYLIIPQIFPFFNRFRLHPAHALIRVLQDILQGITFFHTDKSESFHKFAVIVFGY